MSRRRGRPGAERPFALEAEPITVLIVDDDPIQAELLRLHLHRPGRVSAVVVHSGPEALDRLRREPVDAVVSDVLMDEMDGIELVRRIRVADPALPVILVSAAATLDRAVDGMRAGATDFLQKPVNVTVLSARLERAVRERPLREAMSVARARTPPPVAAEYLAGAHPRLDAVREFAARIAETPNARVLVTGETGTGKSLLARAIHEISRAPGRFVQVNCAALPAQLLEAELFGYEKGAFTDARSLKRGLAETAEKGTLFLDEIDALPLELQAKLLVFLETREIRRVGGVDPVPVRTRVVTATSADLHARVREKQFRADLLYRLDVASVTMPPLRELPGVVPELARRFAAELAAELGHPAPELSPESVSRLDGYPWPGNARELRNAVERAMIFHRRGALEVHPPAAGTAAAEDDPRAVRIGLDATLNEVERRYLEAVLAANAGDLGSVAARLGISRKTLWEKRRRHGL
ncbi:MAG TPA: sigma-54 dependent transcriptional regulator [Longimicrobium sp.]|nr:sigma-54 dependent transcriptional regulator [Longimicrobium sp.]